MTPTLNVGTWNIRGAAPDRLETVVAAAATLDADVLVLTESTRQHLALHDLFAGHGWDIHATLPPARYRGVAIAVRSGVTTERVEVADPCSPWAGVAALRVEGVTLIGLYGPGSDSVVDGRKIKEEWWRGLHRIADDHRQLPAIMIGDLNNGVRGVDEWSRTFHRSELFEQLADHGFDDGWRSRHGSAARAASWWSRTGHPFRLDHIHTTRSLAVLEADYVLRSGGHQLVSPPGEGRSGVSDHAALVATIGLLG
ncbi:endonuclease/exonuclease/phosphatase family metal-dependent hydrolase [Ilumatobacter fluminis]|uniref:Endonuclease/exonuclease/phosphatase family metal-dependent hydrolase n=1 Tax=Ilumatobacter fluminis TaxID=467091 RepID=A0A4R7HUJ3_9ACTN|nr:endonuclease/exonuclease/phosphatase family protein [Ilumatobacter fluminis]TDT14611.1 endonuclease/exonuclease/phosphatase family metal-dependent hydrolase [Ilumatobacter fluminis]